MTFVLFLKKQKQNSNKNISQLSSDFFKDYYPLKFVKEQVHSVLNKMKKYNSIGLKYVIILNKQCTI